MGDRTARDDPRLQEDGGTYGLTSAKSVTDEVMQCVPVTDISIMVPLVTFSNRRKRLIS